MTLLCLLAANTDKSMPDMLKFWACDLDEQFVSVLSRGLQRESSTGTPMNNFTKVFIYHNPLPDPMVFASLCAPQCRLQFLTLNNCGLTVESVQVILDYLPQHRDLVYLDLHGNKLGDAVVGMLAKTLAVCDTIEAIGLGANCLSDVNALENLLAKVGKAEVGKDWLAKYEERLRERNLMLEKNKKLRSLKKPEEYVFYLDELLVNEETKGRQNSQQPLLFISRKDCDSSTSWRTSIQPEF